MAQKKHYYYDKSQFVDKEGRLFFLMNQSPLDYDKIAYHMVDIFNDPFIFTSLDFFSPVLDTYKHIVDAKCEEMDFSHRSPTGFLKNIRNEVIHACLIGAYKSVKDEYKPSVESLGTVFRVSHANIIQIEKRHFSEVQCA